MTVATPLAQASSPLIELQDRDRASAWQRTVRSLLANRVAIAGILILLTMVLAAVFAPVVAPYDPDWQERGDRLVGPLTRSEKTGNFYILGTDPLGRDILSRLIYGARVSLLIGFLSVAVSAPVGVLLGLLSGYGSKWLDDVVMRVADIQLAFPFILLAMVIVSVLGPSIRNLILVLAISGWVIYARVVRGTVMRLRRMEFVQSAEAVGCTWQRILFRHLMPNALTPAIVLVTFGLASMILLESSLSFLGLGVQPPTPSWGAMLNEARNYIAQAWWASVMPGAAIMLTVLSVNFLGDWLRDILDPREQVR